MCCVSALLVAPVALLRAAARRRRSYACHLQATLNSPQLLSRLTGPQTLCICATMRRWIALAVLLWPGLALGQPHVCTSPHVDPVAIRASLKGVFEIAGKRF